MKVSHQSREATKGTRPSSIHHKMHRDTEGHARSDDTQEAHWRKWSWYRMYAEHDLHRQIVQAERGVEPNDE